MRTLQYAEAAIDPLRNLYRIGKAKPGVISSISPEAFDGICDAVGIASRCFADPKTYIVTNAYGWGKGHSIKQAKAKCKSQNPRTAYKKPPFVYRAFLVHAKTTMDGLSINYPQGCEPVELGEV